MPKFDLRAIGSVEENTLGTSFGANIVGTGRVLADDNPATYVYLEPGAGTNPGIASSRLASSEVPLPSRSPSYRVYGLLKHSGGLPPQFIVTVAGSTELGRWNQVDPAQDGGDGWMLLPLTLAAGQPGWPSQFIGVDITLNSNFSSPDPHTITEAGLRVSWNRDAPPCRIFPRRDGLGVGAGVAYPPPRSQQRSPGRRGVGYY